MPTLKFKGKEFIYSHHLSVPFRPLNVDKEKSLPPKGKTAGLDDNLIIQGDNLEALKSLLPVYAGKVDCIYIDPPYNTGTEGWCYNDKVNSPLMKEWLKKASNPVDLEDMERHDKWLCMMWSRLQLLRELLSETGVIFVSIDDNEAHRLRMMMDEIFGEVNFVVNIAWRSGDSSNNDAKTFSNDYNETLVYRKSELWLPKRIERTEENNAHYKNPDNDPRGAWFSGNVSSPNPRKNLGYKITTPSESIISPPSNGWRWKEEKMLEMIKTGEVIFSEDETRIIKKTYLSEQGGLAPSNIWCDIEETGHNRQAKYEQIRLFPEKITSEQFKTPKPIKFIRKILKIATSKNSLILDSFAGSGTTAERIRRVINGYASTGTDKQELLKEKITFSQLKKADALLEKVALIETKQKDNFDKISKTVKDSVLIVTGETKVKERKAGIGGSFTYAILGEPINLDNMLQGTMPSFSELAKYVFYTATGLSLDESAISSSHYYIGESKTHRVYLIYQAKADFLRTEEAALDKDKLNTIIKHHQQHSENKGCLIFAAAKFMGQNSLLKQGVEFCQLPYAIHRLEGEN